MTCKEQIRVIEASSIDHQPTDLELCRRIWQLALPVLVQQALIYLVGLSDTLITGWYLSADDLAAVTVATYISWFLGGLLAIVSAGASALVARMVGAENMPEANRITGVSISLGILVGFGILGFGLMLAESIIIGMNMTGLAADAAITYFKIVVLAGPLIAIRIVGMTCLAGAGDTRTGSIAMCVVNLINIFLSWALVVGFMGLPKWGIAGVAAGTAIGEAVGGLLILIALIIGRAGIRLQKSILIPDWERTWRIVRISLPTVGETGTNIAGQIWFLALINRLGAVSTASHGVAIKCESIAYLMVGGFAVPAGILAGQFLGANRPDLARRASNICLVLGNLLLALMGVALFCFDEEMFQLFLGSGKPELIETGAPMLPLIAFAMPGLASINVLAATLRGAGATQTPWYLAIVGFFMVRIPITFILARPVDGTFWALGLKGAWVGMLVDLNSRGLMLAIAYFRGNWTITKV